VSRTRRANVAIVVWAVVAAVAVGLFVWELRAAIAFATHSREGFFARSPALSS
jgi:hypothetical protein